MWAERRVFQGVDWRKGREIMGGVGKGVKGSIREDKVSIDVGHGPPYAC